MESALTFGLEKPLNFGTYDGTFDPDEHIENIDVLLDYIGGSRRNQMHDFSYHDLERSHGMVQESFQ